MITLDLSTVGDKSMIPHLCRETVEFLAANGSEAILASFEEALLPRPEYVSLSIVEPQSGFTKPQMVGARAVDLLQSRIGGESDEKGLGMMKIVIIAVSGSLVLLLCIILCLCYIRRRHVQHVQLGYAVVRTIFSASVLIMK